MAPPDGANGITLATMPAPAATSLARRFAAIDPWRRLAVSAEHIERQLRGGPEVEVRLIAQSGEPVGAAVVRPQWLLGPYLQLLAIVPEAQGKGAGSAALAWLDALAHRNGQANAWLCVSAFNHDAIAFYRRHGFRPVATLDDLVRAGEDEILMRRRLPR